MKAVPAGAGRQARRASDRLRFRVNGRGGEGRTNVCGDAMPYKRRRARQCCAAASPARSRRASIRATRARRWSSKKKEK